MRDGIFSFSGRAMGWKGESLVAAQRDVGAAKPEGGKGFRIIMGRRGKCH